MAAASGLGASVRQGLQSAGLLGLVALFVQLARLFVVPGARQRRKRLAYRLANLGRPPKGLPEIPPVTRLSSRVIRVIGQNPGAFTLQGTNTYIVGTGERRVLVDAGDGNAPYHRTLLETLRDVGATISDIVITHEHEDHVGGIPKLRDAFPDALIWKKPKRAKERDPSGQFYDRVLENATVVAVRGATLRAVLTPGHTADHVALVLEEEAAIFTGDCVLGSGTAVFENLHEYVGSLRILLRELEIARVTFSQDQEDQEDSGVATADDDTLASDDARLQRGFSEDESAADLDADLRPGRLYPGHGVLVRDGSKRIKDYLEHRQLREDQIVAFLGDDKGGAKTVHALVDIIYGDQNLSWVVKRGAVRSITQHLDKLQREARVAKVGKQWMLADPVAAVQPTK